MQLITEKKLILWGNSNSWLNFKFEFDLKEIELENEIWKLFWKWALAHWPGPAHPAGV
jgi:hypothetical protein